MKEITDALELEVVEILNNKNINFIHESEKNFPIKGNRKLDFYLPHLDVYIEIKANHTDRLYSQIKEYKDCNNPNIVIIIGRKGVNFLKSII